jgi:hypothetical protein
MKYLPFFVIAIFLLGAACSKESDLFEVMLHEDEEALAGMHEAYENALAFNDSLIYCQENAADCTPGLLTHYDEMFHSFDEMYTLYHNNYSHNNLTDDHHHSATSPHNHGTMHHSEEGEHHEEEGEHHEEESEHEEDSHGYVHNIQTFLEMQALREKHQLYHPE